MSNALAVGLILLSGAVAASAPLQEIVQKTYALSPSAELRVRNTDGTIYIYGSEVSELKVWARKKAYSKERLEAISIDVSIEGEKARIDTIYPPRPEGWSLRDRSGTVDYVILVPETCSVSQIELVNGEIIVAGMRGSEVHARLTNGVIRADDCFSHLQLVVEQGGMAVSYHWWEAGAVSLLAELGHGEMSVALPPDPSVRLDAASVSGRITNQFGQEHGQGDGRNLQTTIGADGGAVFKIRTNSANIKVEKDY